MRGGKERQGGLGGCEMRLGGEVLSVQHTQGCCSREQSWEQHVRLEDLQVMRTRELIRSAGAGLGKLGTPPRTQAPTLPSHFAEVEVSQ